MGSVWGPARSDPGLIRHFVIYLFSDGDVMPTSKYFEKRFHTINVKWKIPILAYTLHGLAHNDYSELETQRPEFYLIVLKTDK